MPEASEGTGRGKGLAPIAELARDRLGAPEDALIPYGRRISKLALPWLSQVRQQPQGKLLLVTSMTSTSRGEGKTGVAIGLCDALNLLGKRAVVCLRQPSMGPVFGLKGGASGGGRSRLIPSEEINLHFTGDFHAVGAAHNLLAALLENHRYWRNAIGIDPATIGWRRVMDLGDRSLRNVLTSAEPPWNPNARITHFDITPASEVMAVLALAESWKDLSERLSRIVVSRDRQGRPVRSRDLSADGAMASLLRDALAPNLVQTLEGNPALVHAGPFANIAHGCSSVIASRAALGLSEFVVTEAGFGADLGAEKFVDIKCRQSGLRPSAAVIVATLSTLKHHGGAAPGRVDAPDGDALERGMANLARHVAIVREVLGIPAVVCINRFAGDTETELAAAAGRIESMGVPARVSEHWERGGAGARDLALEALQAAEAPVECRYAYDDGLPLLDKMEILASDIYGAADIRPEPAALRELDWLESHGFGNLPLCVAKTQSSLSADPLARGAPYGHAIPLTELRLAAGAGFIVALCGDIATMPGLPPRPRAENIRLTDDGQVKGL